MAESRRGRSQSHRRKHANTGVEAGRSRLVVAGRSCPGRGSRGSRAAVHAGAGG